MLHVANGVNLSDGVLPKTPSDGPGPITGNEFTISPRAHKALVAILSQNRVNPYEEYSQFRLSIRALISDPKFPQEVRNICSSIRASREKNEQLHFLVRNVPVDRDVPDFSNIPNTDPVRVKYAVKKTFIGEAALEMFSQFTGSPLLAYSTRNNGDFFQDVISEKKYKGTQTQKTDGELFPHNDRTAHDIRPDILNLLAMRPTRGNVIPTTYFDGRTLLAALSPGVVEALKQPIFFTPFDDFSRASNPGQQKSEPHAVLSFADENAAAPMFRFYSGRTEALSGPTENTATSALLKLERAIIGMQKYRVNLELGDLLSIPNLRGLHSRDIVAVPDPEARARRWLLKTYAFWNDEMCRRFAGRFDSTTSGRVVD